jgi:hypothetical protein
MLDLRGHTVPTRNLTADPETGIGRWSEQDFVTAVRSGFRPDRTLLRYPMVLLPDLSDPEGAALYAYLRSVPAIRNPLPKPPAVPTAGAKLDGKALYEQYGCVSCHGDDGIGIADLRQAAEHYPTQEALEFWILDAPRVRPGTGMPGWRGVIHEEHLKPLIDHVLQLGKTRS